MMILSVENVVRLADILLSPEKHHNVELHLDEGIFENICVDFGNYNVEFTLPDGEHINHELNSVVYIFTRKVTYVDEVLT